MGYKWKWKDFKTKWGNGNFHVSHLSNIHKPTTGISLSRREKNLSWRNYTPGYQWPRSAFNCFLHVLKTFTLTEFWKHNVWPWILKKRIVEFYLLPMKFTKILEGNWVIEKVNYFPFSWYQRLKICKAYGSQT